MINFFTLQVLCNSDQELYKLANDFQSRYNDCTVNPGQVPTGDTRGPATCVVAKMSCVSYIMSYICEKINDSICTVCENTGYLKKIDQLCEGHF